MGQDGFEPSAYPVCLKIGALPFRATVPVTYEAAQIRTGVSGFQTREDTWLPYCPSSFAKASPIILAILAGTLTFTSTFPLTVASTSAFNSLRSTLSNTRNI